MPGQALHGDYVALASVPLMVEYEAVATRAEHLQASGLTEAEVHVVLGAFAAVVEPGRLAFLRRPRLPEVDDDTVLVTAVNGQAHMLVTLDQRVFLPAAGAFNLQVVSPGGALTRLRRRA